METTETLAETQVEGPILVDNPQTSKASKPLSRKEVDQKAKEMKDMRTLPPIPGKQVSDKEVTDWLAILTPEMSKRIVIYAYRTYPIINRKALDPEANNNIDIITPEILSTKGGVLRDYMVSVHGGGRYKIQINDSYADRKTEVSSLFECKLLIPLDESMPKLNYAELDTADQANKGYLQQLRNAGIVDERNRFISKVGPSNNSNGQTTTSIGNDSAALVGAMGTIMDKFLAFANRNDNKGKDDSALTQLFIEKLKQENPAAATQSNNDLLKILLPLLLKEQPKPEFSTKDILLIIQDSNNKSMEMMKAMMENNKKEDTFETIAKVKAVFPDMFASGKSRRSNGNDEDDEGSKTWKDKIFDLAIESIPGVLGIASQFIQARTGAKPVIPVTEGQAREMVNPNQNGPSVQPQTNIQQVPPPNRNTGVDLRAQGQITQGQDNKVVEMPNPNPTSTTNATTEEPDPRFSPIVAEMLAAYGMMLINAIESGQSGEETGDQLKVATPLLKKDVHAILAGQGIEKIIFTMKCNPQLWEKLGGVYGEDAIRQFVERFINFEKYLDEAEGEE